MFLFLRHHGHGARLAVLAYVPLPGTHNEAEMNSNIRNQFMRIFRHRERTEYRAEYTKELVPDRWTDVIKCRIH
jgi:hypothetical protein